VTYESALAYDESGYLYEGALAFGENLASGLTSVSLLPRLEVAFGVDADTEPAESDWIDLSERLRDFDGGPGGRQKSLDRIEAGAMTFVLSNDDRALDATNITSLYYPNVIPMVHVRFTEAVSGRPLFRGYADGWPMQFPFHGKDQTVTLTATDGQKVMAGAQLSGTVWERQVQALADDGTVRMWFRLGDPPGSRQLLDSGPNRFAAQVLGGPKFGEEGLLIPGASTSTAFWQDRDQVAVDVAAAFTTPNWTVEALIRRPYVDDLPQDSAGAELILVMRDALVAGAENSIAIGFPAAATFGRFLAEVTIAGSATQALSAGTVWDDKVHHVAAKRTWDGVAGSVKVFIDGLLVNTVTLNSSVAPAFTAVSIGNYSRVAEAGGTLNFRGRLQELVTYASALPDADIAEHARWALTPFAGVSSSQAVSDALDDVSWPAARRRLAGGVSTLQDHALGGDALAYIQKVTETEAGIFGFDESGDAVFYGREYVQSQDRLTHLLTFANDPDDELGWVPYDEVEFANDDTNLVNEVRASREGGVDQVVRDSDSVDKYLLHGDSLSGLLHNNDSEVLEHARFIVNKGKEFRTEVRKLVVNLRDPRIDVDHLLGAFEGNSPGLLQVRVVHQWLGFDDPLDGTYRVERVEHSGRVADHEWLMTLWLSSWEADQDIPWILEDAVYGRLSDAELGF
jgi:concanavalin A-like lectin/glucanase superfamily protein